MTYIEILELIRAGYTRAEIDAMQQAERQQAAGSAPGSEVEPEQKEEEQKQTAPDPVPKSVPEQQPEKKEPTEVEKLVSALGLKIDRMTAAIQGRNIQMAENPNTEMTPEQVVARIINPHI